MVKIAIAGGSGGVGREILDALVARNKHDITILSRRDEPETEIAPGVKWAKADYENVDELADVLQGVHTVLSFMAIGPGETAKPQINLIDASVKAGVRRFAPSEWVSAGIQHTPWYAFKEETRKYLEEINKDKKVLEYTLFQMGLFTNYMTHPFSSTKHVPLFKIPFDFENLRALLVDDGEAVITLTTVQDSAEVTALAIEYEGEWPRVSGVKGGDITLNQLIGVGEKVRGKPFNTEYLRSEDLLANDFKGSWVPLLEHPTITTNLSTEMLQGFTKGMLLSFNSGDFQVSDEWNRLLPDYKFTSPEEFLTEAWKAFESGAKSIFTEY